MCIESTDIDLNRLKVGDFIESKLPNDYNYRVLALTGLMACVQHKSKSDATWKNEPYWVQQVYLCDYFKSRVICGECGNAK